jgi:hypothetical protein
MGKSPLHNPLAARPHAGGLGELPEALAQRLQSSAVSLRRGDTVRLLSFDDDWLIDAAIVDRADLESVSFCGPSLKVLRLTPQSGGYEDSNFRCEPHAGSWRVVRKKDGVTMAAGFTSLVAAQNALAGLYPKRVA